MSICTLVGERMFWWRMFCKGQRAIRLQTSKAFASLCTCGTRRRRINRRIVRITVLLQRQLLAANLRRVRPLTVSAAPTKSTFLATGNGLQNPISPLAQRNRQLSLGQLVVIAALSASFCSRSVSAESILKNPGTAVPSKVMAEGSVAGACETTNGVPDLEANNVGFLAENGVTITPLPVLGAEVVGLDLKATTKDSPLLPVLQKEMARRGYLVFRGQGVLSGDEQVAASELFGGQQIHSTHGVHPKAPNEHIFRLSNDQEHGILGVGPQWHNDGSFERAVFSHVGYHIIRVPENGGATTFCHQGAAFDHLSEEEQEVWQRRVSVNSNSGVVHPMVHEHPISGRKSVYLHLGMTGAVLEMKKGIEKVTSMEDLRPLNQEEMTALFNRYNNLLNDPKYSRDHNYEEGDCIIIDNLAIAHRASKEAHGSAKKQGLRILHRTTVKGMIDFDPQEKFSLPPMINVYGQNPFGSGVWIGGGLGFRWDPNIHMQN